MSGLVLSQAHADRILLVSALPRLSEDPPARPADEDGRVEWVNRVRDYCTLFGRDRDARYDVVFPKDLNQNGEECIWMPIEDRPSDEEELKRRWRAGRTVQFALSSLERHCDGKVGYVWAKLLDEVHLASSNLRADLARLEGWMVGMKEDAPKGDDSSDLASAVLDRVLESLEVEWSDDASECRAQIVSIVTEQWREAEEMDNEPLRGGLTRIQLALHSFLQYSDPKGSFPKLDSAARSRVKRRVALANVLCAAMDLIDGRSWEELGTLKAMRCAHHGTWTRVTPNWTLGSARSICKALLDRWKESPLSSAFKPLPPLDYHPKPLSNSVYSEDPEFNTTHHRVLAERFGALGKDNALRTFEGEYAAHNITVEPWTEDLAEEVKKELELWEEGEGRARVGVVVRMLDEMVDRPQAAREGAFNFYLLVDNFVLLRRLVALLDASTESPIPLLSHVSVIRTLLAISLVSTRPDLISLVLLSYLYRSRYDFVMHAGDAAKASVINNRVMLEAYDLAAAMFMSSTLLHSHRRTGRAAGLEAMLTDTYGTCDAAGCVRRVSGEDHGLDEVAEMRLRPSSRARQSRTGSLAWRSVLSDDPPRMAKYPCPDSILAHGDDGCVRVVATLVRRCVHFGCRAGMGKAGAGTCA